MRQGLKGHKGRKRQVKRTGHLWCFFLMLAAVCLFTTTVAAGEPYHWPLDLPRDLSSSFAEYRTGRFHAGIDLRTGGVTGKPVYAASDGYVSRVRCSPWGYGKAIYVQFKDGNSAVYAHLDDYYDPLRDYVRQQQHKHQSFTVDLYPQPEQFPIQTGQQIALSGSTGVGPPHLHYELRDAGGRPFNPRLVGIEWPDTTMPVIRKVMVSPDGPAGRVNGGYAPVVLEAHRQNNGQYVTDPITVSGRIGVGVDVIDPGNDGIKMGVHTLRLLQNNQEVFEVLHDYLSYDNIRNGAVAYHPFFLDKGRFLLLWRWPGNVCPLYTQSPGDGWVNITDTPSELHVEATDFLGNKTVVVIPIQPESQTFPSDTNNSSGTVSMTCYGEYLTFTATFNTSEGKAPELLMENGEDIVLQPFRRVSERLWMAAFKPIQSGVYSFCVHHPRISAYAETVYAVLRGDRQQPICVNDVQVSIAPDAPYGVMFIRISPVAKSLESLIPQIGNAWHIWPDAMPLDASVELTLPLQQDAARARLYRRTGDNWHYEGSKRQGNHLTASVHSFGTYAILEDTLSPGIAEISPPDGYHAKTQRPIVRAVITDVGSGIADYTVTANGQWLLVSYDPDTSQIAWERDEELPSGKQELIFRVTDNVGNTTTSTRTVYIP